MTEPIRFREGGLADREGILALREAAFPDIDAEKRQAAFWEWQFLRGYEGGRFFVAEAGRRIIGHLGFLGQRYRLPEDVRGALALDAMTHPDFQRQSVFRRLARFAAESVKDDFEVIIAFQIRQAVMEGMAGAGWRPVENVPILLKVLSLRRALADFWTEPPPPRPSPIESEPDIRAIAPDNFPQLEALSASPSMRQARTSEFLDWRYCRNPHWRYRSDGLFDGTRLRAFVVSRQAMLRGRWTLAIADAGGEASALARLVRHVCARDGAGLGLAAALLSRHHPAYRAMRTSGFVPGPHRFRLLVLGRKQVSGWSISWGDTDHL